MRMTCISVLCMCFTLSDQVLKLLHPYSCVHCIWHCLLGLRIYRQCCNIRQFLSPEKTACHESLEHRFSHSETTQPVTVLRDDITAITSEQE